MPINLVDPLITRGVSKEFLLAVQMGRLPNFSSFSKFGYNAAIAINSTPEDVMSQGGVYTFSTASAIDTASGSDTGDAGNILRVEGLIDTGDRFGSEGYIQLNGQNKVLIYTDLTFTVPMTFYRINRVRNVSDAGGELVGNAYVYEDTAITQGVPNDSTLVRAVVIGVDGVTQQAVLTVPRNYVGFLLKGTASLLSVSGGNVAGDLATVEYNIRPNGKTFIRSKIATAIAGGSSTISEAEVLPLPVPGLTDIKVSVSEVTDTVGVSAFFDVLFINQTEFYEDFLVNLQQPDYV